MLKMEACLFHSIFIIYKWGDLKNLGHQNVYVYIYQLRPHLQPLHSYKRMHFFLGHCHFIASLLIFPVFHILQITLALCMACIPDVFDHHTLNCAQVGLFKL